MTPETALKPFGGQHPGGKSTSRAYPAPSTRRRDLVALISLTRSNPVRSQGMKSAGFYRALNFYGLAAGNVISWPAWTPGAKGGFLPWGSAV